MSVLLTNNATTQLATSLTTGTTTLSVTAGTGGKFPAPGPSQWFPVTLVKANGTLEICRCTSRSGDVLTVARAQEGTAAQAFAAGDRVELRLTNAAMSEFAQTTVSNNWSQQQTFAGGFASGSTGRFVSGVPESPRLYFANSGRSANMDLSGGVWRLFSEDNSPAQVGLQLSFGDGSFLVFGNNVWHTGNLNPAAYLPLGAKAADSDLLDGRDSSGYLMKAASNVNCESTRITSAIVPNISAAQQNQTALAIDNGANTYSSASIELHRLGQFIAFFGIDTDNQLKVGGGSFGAVAYPIWTDYNGNLKATNAQAALPVGSVGSYAFCRNLNGITLGAGAVLSGAELRYTDTSNAGGIAPPSGSWRSMGECRSGYSSLWLRYA
jgi:hypothetical protein